MKMTAYVKNAAFVTNNCHRSELLTCIHANIDVDLDPVDRIVDITDRDRMEVIPMIPTSSLTSFA